MGVFYLEWANACRRGKHHRLRSRYVIALLIEALALLVSWTDRFFFARLGTTPIQEIGAATWFFFRVFAWQHFALILVLTPGMMAGTISDEKARGTLALLLTTELTSWEIVAGKWLGQLTQVLVISLSALPLLLFLGLLSGVEPVNLILLLAETLLLLMALAAVGLLSSLWSRRTTRAVIGLYLFVAACWLVVELAGWRTEVRDTLLAPVLPQEARGNLGVFLPIAAVLAGITALCLALATWRLRPVVAAELSGPTRRSGASSERPPPADSPLRWKERFVGELGYLRFLRGVPTWVKLGAVALLGLWQEVDYDPWKPMIQGAVFLVAVSLLTGIRCSGVVTGEREKETWASLLLTPLEPRQILRGKLWGIIDSVRPYMLAYLVPAFVLSLRHGDVEAPFDTLFFWLCTWGLVYYMAANGLLASVRGPNSWMSLIGSFASAGLAILQFGFICAALAGSVALGFVMVATLLASLFWLPTVHFFIEVYVVCFLGMLVLCLFATSEQTLEEAEKSLMMNERVMQRDPPGGRARKSVI